MSLVEFLGDILTETLTWDSVDAFLSAGLS